MTADILTPGHIKCIEYLRQRGPVIIGLLTDEALEGYKTPRVPFKDRSYIIETIAKAFGDVEVVPQSTLDPLENLVFYECEAIASGDGFEAEEQEAIDLLGITPIHIRFEGETEKTYSSSRL